MSTQAEREEYEPSTLVVLPVQAYRPQCKLCSWNGGLHAKPMDAWEQAFIHRDARHPDDPDFERDDE